MHQSKVRYPGGPVPPLGGDSAAARLVEVATGVRVGTPRGGRLPCVPIRSLDRLVIRDGVVPLRSLVDDELEEWLQ